MVLRYVKIGGPAMKVELSELKPEDIPMELIQSHPFVQELTDNIICNQDLEKEVTLPYIHENVVLMSPGKWNGFTYSADTLKKAFTTTDWTNSDVLALYLDHLDTSARDWIGEVFNVRMKGDTLIGDLRIVSDKPTAMALAYGAHLGISPKVEGDADELTQEMNHFAYSNFSVVKHPAVKTAYINSQNNPTTDDKPIIIPLEVKKLAEEEKPIEAPVEEPKEEVKTEVEAPAEVEAPKEEAPAEEAPATEMSEKPFEMSEEMIATLAAKLAPVIAEILAKKEMAETPAPAEEKPEEKKKPEEEEKPNEMAAALNKLNETMKTLSDKVETLSAKKVEVKNSEVKLAEPARVSKKAPAAPVVKELSQEQKDTAMYNLFAQVQGNNEKIIPMEGM